MRMASRICEFIVISFIAAVVTIASAIAIDPPIDSLKIKQEALGIQSIIREISDY